MTPEAKQRLEVYQEGQRAFNGKTPCPYTDWRAGTWRRGWQAACDYDQRMQRENALADAAQGRSQPEPRELSWLQCEALTGEIRKAGVGNYVDVRNGGEEIVLDGTFDMGELEVILRLWKAAVA